MCLCLKDENYHNGHLYTSSVGEDISVAYYRKTYTILRDDLNVSVDAINITDDTVPETKETFTLSLMKDESERGDTLNVNPRNTILELTIVDNDGTYRWSIKCTVNSYLSQY